MYVLSFLRACEPANSLVSLVSTNNLMLVMFKAAQIKEWKEFHGYFEVITQESRFVLCLEMCLLYCFCLRPQSGCHIPEYRQMTPVSQFLFFLHACLSFISSALLMSAFLLSN